MPKSRLSTGARIFIVKSLACFDAPSLVIAAVKSEFGESVTPQMLTYYDPTKAAGRRALARRWRLLFEQTRKDFLDELNTIGVSHRAARLRKLDRHVMLHDEAGNSIVMARLLKQAAEEMGDIETNRHRPTRRVEGRDISHRERAKAILLKLARAKGARTEPGSA
jgi:hypothetical protein